MKEIDTRFSVDEKLALQGLIGERFKSYQCDEFLFRPSVYQLVGMNIGHKTYVLENVTQPLDYYGSIEDVGGVLSFKESFAENIESRVVGGSLLTCSIDQEIKDIEIIEDVHTMIKNGVPTYKYSYTKAIVFVLPDRQLAFEKDIWLSEDIFIYKGVHVSDSIMPIESELGESNDCEFVAERLVSKLSDS